MGEGNDMHFHYSRCESTVSSLSENNSKVDYILNSENAYHFLFSHHYYAYSYTTPKC